MVIDDILPMSADLGNGLIPGDADKLATTLWTDSSQGIKQTIGMIDTIQVAIDLSAEPATSYGMVRTPLNAHSAPLFIDVRLQGTGVGAVMRAGTIYYTQIAALSRLHGSFQGHCATLSFQDMINALFVV